MSESAPIPIRLKIFLLEDERNLGEVLSETLVDQGYEVHWIRTCFEAKAVVDATKNTAEAFACAVLDIQLPDGSGFEIANIIRKSSTPWPVVFISAFGEADMRLRGFELGAEDYVVKPFHAEELLYRLKRIVQLRGHSEPQQAALLGAPVSVGKADIYLQRFEIIHAVTSDRLAVLTQKECLVLRLLIEAQGAVLSRDEILNRVWGEEVFPSPRTIDNMIVKMRKAIELDPDNPQCLRSVRGVGYQLLQSSSEEKNI